MLDLTSVIVGAVVGVAATFAAGWVWFFFSAPPNERARRRQQKWREKAERLLN